MASKPDLSEFFRLSRPKKKPCAIAYVLEGLTDEESQQLQAALAHDRGIITGGAIRVWLKGRGSDVSIPAITSHRSGACTCND